MFKTAKTNIIQTFRVTKPVNIPHGIVPLELASNDPYDGYYINGVMRNLFRLESAPNGQWQQRMIQLNGDTIYPYRITTDIYPMPVAPVKPKEVTPFNS